MCLCVEYMLIINVLNVNGMGEVYSVLIKDRYLLKLFDTVTYIMLITRLWLVIV